MLTRSPLRRAPKDWTKPERKWPTPQTLVPAVMRSAAADAPVITPKLEPVRSEEYRRYVASFPCFACGLEKHSQAAHSDSGADGKGLALKACDRFIFPLCANLPLRVGCHAQFDLLIDMTLEDRQAAEAIYIPRMHALAVADGWDIDTLRRTR